MLQTRVCRHPLCITLAFRAVDLLIAQVWRPTCPRRNSQSTEPCVRSGLDVTMAEWTTIESDPGVFTELMERMGVDGVQMEELYSLDRDSLAALQPIYGLIFLFKWQKETDHRPVDAEYESRGVFFASQVINNACATQAIISVLMNRPELEIGPELSQLKEFTSGFPSDMKGLAIGNSDQIRTLHNSFHPPQSIVPEKDEDEKGGEAFHFIAYLPVAGGLYELDGLKPGPLRLAECSNDDWLEKAAQVINERISRYSQSEIRFNIMALIRDRRAVCREQQQRQLTRAARIRARLEGRPEPSEAAGAGDEEPLPSDPDTLAAALAAATEEAARAGAQLALEEEKRRLWAEENLRRKTDFIPAIFQLLQGLADENKLQPLVDRAVEVAKQKQQQSAAGDS